MKQFNAILVLLFFCFFGFIASFADTIVMSNNRLITGTAIQTNEHDVLVLAPYAAFNFSKSKIKEINNEPVTASNFSETNRLPDFQSAILFLSRQAWATNLSPIPATVIDKGILKNVPYSSFRCGEDYEVNIYGDLEKPAGIEIGVYRKLLEDSSAKHNCIKFISDILNQSADKSFVQTLDLNNDLKSRDDLIFEITPPTAEDAYNGWWISVYSTNQLNLSRASDVNMELVSMTQADASKDAKRSTNYADWSVNELSQSRPPSKTIVTITTSSGEVITNAEVVRVIDGVGLIWRNGPNKSGMVRLADLSEDLRNQFGYDEAKTKAADNLAAENKARWQQEVQAAQAAQTAQDAATILDPSFYDYSGYSGGDYSGGGRVYVHGYTRSNGTYVNAYTRSYPNSKY